MLLDVGRDVTHARRAIDRYSRLHISDSKFCGRGGFGCTESCYDEGHDYQSQQHNLAAEHDGLADLQLHNLLKRLADIPVNAATSPDSKAFAYEKSCAAMREA